MDNPKSLFNNNTKVCENCKRPLPHDYKENLCPRCLDLALFREVKEFIRTHDVNEYEVAEHFKIPLRQVKSWIKDGRIEYKQSESASTIAGLHCQRCGAPVTHSLSQMSETVKRQQRILNRIRCRQNKIKNVPFGRRGVITPLFF